MAIQRRRIGWLRLIVVGVALLLMPPAVARAAGPSHVDVLHATGVVDPVFAGYVDQGIRQAEQDGAQAVIVELDTPGGLDTSMREIIQTMVNAQVPVVIYVYPPGARAASAGLFITQAAHVAAMAPDTNIGSAHPVGLSATGQTQAIDPVEEAKVTNDAVALIRGLATNRGRNADWVEQAVRQSVNVPAEQAVELKVVDLEASSLSDLLQKLDGRTVQLRSGPQTLSLKDAEIVDLPPSFLEQIWHAVSDPTVAYILMTLGVYALIYEVTSPGAIVPGVLGVLFLVIGLFALGTLSVNLAGLALIVFGFALLVAEVLVLPGSGLLAAGGLISLLIGSLLLMTGTSAAGGIAPVAVIAVIVFTAGFFAIVSRGVIAVSRRRPTTGREGLVGAEGVARSELNLAGRVFVHGELWEAATTAGPIAAGQRVRVVGLKGLRLFVEPIVASKVLVESKT
jgi:membrane-bound serine protease (ClpP class)